MGCHLRAVAGIFLQNRSTRLSLVTMAVRIFLAVQAELVAACERAEKDDH